MVWSTISGNKWHSFFNTIFDACKYFIHNLYLWLRYLTAICLYNGCLYFYFMLYLTLTCQASKKKKKKMKSSLIQTATKTKHSVTFYDWNILQTIQWSPNQFPHSDIIIFHNYWSRQSHTYMGLGLPHQSHLCSPRHHLPTSSAVYTPCQSNILPDPQGRLAC